MAICSPVALLAVLNASIICCQTSPSEAVSQLQCTISVVLPAAAGAVVGAAGAGALVAAGAGGCGAAVGAAAGAGEDGAEHAATRPSVPTPASSLSTARRCRVVVMAIPLCQIEVLVQAPRSIWTRPR